MILTDYRAFHERIINALCCNRAIQATVLLKQLCQTGFELNNWKALPARQLLPHGAAFGF
jgi:hypothetical protein